MIKCTFAGHAEIFDGRIAQLVERNIDRLLQLDTQFCFFSGGMGDFDHLCEKTVHKFKKLYPQKQIQLVWVAPYMMQRINTERPFLLSQYDTIFIPSELDNLHPKSAITKRNQWMVDHSQYIIASVSRDSGGAYTTLKYASKRNIIILNASTNPCEIK